MHSMCEDMDVGIAPVDKRPVEPDFAVTIIISTVGEKDKRERHLHLTAEGVALERGLSDAQRNRMRDAYRAAGADAVAGFWQVLEAMMDEEMRRHYDALKDKAE